MIPVISLILLAALTTVAWATVDQLHFRPEESTKEKIFSPDTYKILFDIFLFLMIIGGSVDYIIAAAYLNASLSLYPKLRNKIPVVVILQLVTYLCYAIYIAYI